jgi:DNA-binding NarL/FixJ family response regulator
MNPIRIVLADDHCLFLEALKKFLEPQFDVVATFNDGYALLKAAPSLKPDVIILDIGMPLINGLNAGRRLKKLLPETKLIFLTMQMDREVAGEAFRFGTSGYVGKSSAGTELVEAIHKALNNKTYITPLMTKGLVGESFVENIEQRKRPDKLTLRQKEVLQLLVEGRSMKEVAFMLKVSPRTVAFHKYAMMANLQLKSSAELIRCAVRDSLVTC